MLPRELKEADFQTYPPVARKMALEYLALLRELPVPLAAILLRELIDFDTCLPAEHAAVQAQLTFLASLSGKERDRELQGFAALSIPPEIVARDWVHFPGEFEEMLSAHLWQTHQINAFHAAGIQLAGAVEKATPAAKPSIPRLVVVVLSPELRNDGYPLFRKLRTHGVFFSKVDGGGGTTTILNQLAARARETPIPFGHWYIDGGNPLPLETDAISRLSWQGSIAVRREVLQKAQTIIGSGAAGPEMLHSIMAAWEPGGQLAGGQTRNDDPVLDRLIRKIYGEGSGTQIFSTTFVQWSAREVLRRAAPVSMVARFAPRQRQRGMNEMLSYASGPLEMDCKGSLVDADQGAYYTWINLSRLVGFENSSFLAWSEAHQQAVAIGPGLPAGTRALDPMALPHILQMLSN